MLINFALLFLLVGAKRMAKNAWPYLGAALIAAIKFVLYLGATQNPLMASAAGIIFFGLGFGFLFCMRSLDRVEQAEDSKAKDMYARRSSSFKWQYLPMSACVVVILFGEFAIR